MNHTIAVMTTSQTANRNRALPMKICSLPPNVSLLAKIMQTTHRCMFTEFAFSGTILRRKKLHSSDEFLLCKHIVPILFYSTFVLYETFLCHREVRINRD